MRQGRKKGRVEEFSHDRLDVRHWSRLLYPGNEFEAGTFRVTVIRQTFITVRHLFGSRYDATEIAVAWTHCRYGGHRPWFVCPCCRRRCVSLFSDSHSFACRICLNLAYVSQSKSPRARCLSRVRKILHELGGSAGTDSIPPKPQRMHWKTYNRKLVLARDSGLDRGTL